jgi:GntR family transcriptional repressor for pyruvate dehydrogenase complex
MEKLIDKINENAMVSEERINFDSEFHITIAKSGKNVLLGLFVEVMTRQLHDFMIKGAHQLDIKKTYSEHKKIVDSIKERDPDKAEQAMKNHLRAAWKKVATAKSKI